MAVETKSAKPNEDNQQYMDIEDEQLHIENQSAL